MSVLPAGSAAAAAAPPALRAAASTAKAAATSAPAPRPSVRDAVEFASLTALLLDIDGTLTDSDPLHLQAFQEALIARGFNGGEPIDAAFYRERISGRHNPEIAMDLLPHLPQAEQVDFYEWKEARFRELAAGGALVPMPGLFAFLDWARARGLRHAAVTNAPAANTDLMLAGIAVRDRFEHVVLGERCARAKPHPDPYLEAARLLGVAPKASLVVEDSPSGVKAAKDANCIVVGITTSQPAEVLLQAGACCVVEDFEELLKAAKAQGL
jgi:HAD superfamily hydrolase (TIGR01509 family)